MEMKKKRHREGLGGLAVKALNARDAEVKLCAYNTIRTSERGEKYERGRKKMPTPSQNLTLPFCAKPQYILGRYASETRVRPKARVFMPTRAPTLKGNLLQQFHLRTLPATPTRNNALAMCHAVFITTEDGG